MSRNYDAPHEFDEDIEDGSMCMCGVPALTHFFVEPAAVTVRVAHIEGTVPFVYIDPKEAKP